MSLKSIITIPIFMIPATLQSLFRSVYSQPFRSQKTSSKNCQAPVLQVVLTWPEIVHYERKHLGFGPFGS